MSNPIRILKMHPESFRANVYSRRTFRMIGLIDADIEYDYGVERVTLAFYRSSGTNSGKIKGLWYPIVGIKLNDGEFTEFTEYLNYVLTNSTQDGQANKGWLAKSLFFADNDSEEPSPKGFSNGKHYEKLYEIGTALRDLYESEQFSIMDTLDSSTLNDVLTSKSIYANNKHTQRGNFERFIEDIFMEDVYEKE